MSGPDEPIRNRLLIGLGDELLASIRPLERRDVQLHQPLEFADRPIEHVYFPEDCLVSIVTEPPGKGSIEVGVIGFEGMTGIALAYGDTQSPFDSYVQGDGSAWRCEADRLAAAIAKSPKLKAMLLTYARAFSLQVASTSIANGRSVLEERLARWILMVGDRMGTTFHITHELLATMLAVRRPGVTLALQLLEGRHLIRASRGSISIVDRDGLIARANGAYGLAEREYARLLG